MAAADDASQPRKTPIVMQVGILLALTVVAVGSGWLSGSMLSGPTPASAPSAGHGTGEAGEEAGSHALAERLNVFLLEDITTNLAGQDETWVRMAVALVFEGAPDPDMAETIHQDFLAYLRTVKAHQVEGPSGFQHLRSDLEERAAIRSEGKVKRILIRTLLLE